MSVEGTTSLNAAHRTSIPLATAKLPQDLGQGTRHRRACQGSRTQRQLQLNRNFTGDCDLAGEPAGAASLSHRTLAPARTKPCTTCFDLRGPPDAECARLAPPPASAPARECPCLLPMSATRPPKPPASAR